MLLPLTSQVVMKKHFMFKPEEIIELDSPLRNDFESRVWVSGHKNNCLYRSISYITTENALLRGELADWMAHIKNDKFQALMAASKLRIAQSLNRSVELQSIMMEMGGDTNIDHALVTYWKSTIFSMIIEDKAFRAETAAFLARPPDEVRSM